MPTDTDWFRITLTAGATYRFDLEGTATSQGTLVDPFLRLRDSAGNSITSDDDGGTGANARISGYTPTTSGTYYLSAGPSDGGTGTYRVSATQTAAPPAADDYAGSTATTGTVSVGGSRTGSIEVSTDTDWFRITLTAGATYQFDMEGSPTSQGTLANPFLRLRDSAGNSITFDDDSGTGANARISGYTPTTSGTYYLSAGPSDGGTGTYRVSATQTAAPPAADDYAGSTATTGTVSVGGSRTGSIEVSSDTDWFRITLTAGATYQFDMEGSPTSQGTLANPFLRLRDSAGNSITFDDDSGTGANARISGYTPTTSGTYYLSAGPSDAGTGTYRVSATQTAAPPAADDYAGSTATTGTVTAGGTKTGNIETVGDTDWFQTTLTAGRVYQVDVEGSPTSQGSLADPYGSIRNSGGTKVAEADDGGTGANTRFTYTVPAGSGGTYYVAAGSDNNGTGTYRVKLTDITPATPTDEVREGTDTTHSLVLGEARSGRIDAEPISGDGVTSDQQGGYIDKDWYRVTLERGHVYTFNANSTSVSTGAVAINLYNASGSQIRSVTEGASPSFTFDTSGQSSATQTYYFAISAGGPEPTWRTATGNYTLGVADGGAPPPPAADDFRDEATDTSAPFGAVSVGSSATGIIGPADANDTYGDKDVFRIHLQQGQAYEIRLSSTSINSQALPLGIFTIRNPSNFDQVLETSDIGSNVVENFIADVTGDYYVRVGTGGAASDQGGYRLSASNITPASTTDDFPDYPGDTSAISSTPTLSMGPSRTGVIETVGDTDIFQVTLQAGHSYQFSLDSASVSGAAGLSNLYMTLRNSNNFSMRIREDGGLGQATIPYLADQSGAFYIRVGSGSTSGTGGYRLDVYDLGIVDPPPLPPEPTSTSSAVDDAVSYYNYISTQLFKNTTLALADDKLWNTFAAIMVRMNDFEAAQFATRVAKYTPWVGIPLNVGFRVHEAPDGQKVRTAFVASMDEIASSFVTTYGAAKAGAATAAVGTVVPVFGTISAGLMGMVAGGIATKVAYDESGASRFIENSAGAIFDRFIGPLFSKDDSAAGASSEADVFILDEAALIRFDEDWYLSTYPDAVLALASGTAGSAYAHYLTIGIDLGYQPNPSQYLARADLAVTLLNNDPAALGNSALFTPGLGNYAADGISDTEATVASAVNGTRGGAGVLAIDSSLSAIASRKALDLVANFADSAASSAQNNANGAWAESWSNGNQFTQQFRGTFESLLGPDTPGSNFTLFVVASPSSVAADVLQQLQGQTAFAAAMSNAAFDTLGIAEYGGVWVVILADRAVGYSVATPGTDTLASTTQYGSDFADTLYAGARAGRLYGLDGNDLLIGGSQNDLFDGGGGHDVLFGGAGVDTARFHSTWADNLILAFGATTAVFDLVNRERDGMQEIETLHFDDTVLQTAGLPQFRALDYIAGYDDLVRALGVNAPAGFEHFANVGFFEGRAHDGFDGFQYLATYDDLIRGIGPNENAAVEHFIRSGLGEGRARDGFDGFQYLAGADDLIRGIGPDDNGAARHFVTYGFGEHRARDGFDGFQYVAAYDDLIQAFGSNETAAARHFVSYGFGEGRARDGFEGLQYIASHGDLIQALGASEHAGARHFVTNGFGEGRARDAFDAAQYLANYADLQAAFGADQSAATVHFIAHGYFEGRTDDPLFGA